MKPQPWLWPLSILYQAAVQVRNRFYDSDMLPSYDVETPVISVGNISAGGTGKSPFVIYLADRVRQLSTGHKKKVAVISRGYKGNSQGTAVASDGKRLIFGPEIAGDEPVMIAQASPKTIVISDKDRVRGAQVAIKDFGAKIIILDDGFQHRRIKRSLDIVLLDARNPLGNRRLLPAGILREPVSSLARADLIVLSKASGSKDELAERAGHLSTLLSKPVIVTQIVPQYWKRINNSELHTAPEIAGKDVTAFAGIASPSSFFDTIEELGGNIKSAIPFPDHCSYKKRHLDWIMMNFARSRSTWLVTTAKDAVKLPGILHLLPVYYLDTRLEVVFGQEILDNQLKIALFDSNTSQSNPA